VSLTNVLGVVSFPCLHCTAFAALQQRPRNPESDMTILDALRRSTSNTNGGRPAIASRLIKSDDVFRKELSGVSPNHKLGAIDALEAALMCIEAGGAHAYDYAIAVAKECGGRFEVGAAEASIEQSPMQRVSSVIRETSDVTAAFVDSMSDNVVSDNELIVIEREIAEAEAALQAMRRAARASNLASKPAYLKAAA
jgi:hypothetical protein